MAEEKEKKKKKKPLKRRVSKAKKEAKAKEKIEEKIEVVAEAPKEVVPEEKAEAPKKTAAKKPKKKKAEVQKFYGTGRRKTAVARVYLNSGNGSIVVNGKTYKEYFYNRPKLLSKIEAPLKAVESLSKYNVRAVVFGGGIASQAGALSMGIARAVNISQPEFHTVLRRQDFLTRDPREKERKKYGLKRARRAFQYTKR